MPDQSAQNYLAPDLVILFAQELGRHLGRHLAEAAKARHEPPPSSKGRGTTNQ